jgi:hypothetical protein
MKINIPLFLASAAYLFFLGSCEKAVDDESQIKTIAIRNCTPVTQNEFPVICFDSLLTESRCPNGVACPTSGFAAVKLSMKNGSGQIQVFSLSTLGGTHWPTPPNDTTINGYNIKLVNVFPYPDILALPHPDSYKIEVQITP